MSDTTHTPGPWTVSQPSEKYIDTATGSVAALTYGATKADAHLIAAAPDLLAALTKLVANWDANHIPSALDDLSPPNLDIGAARAAIAKAKGN